jgi:N-acetyl-1-D-myo-inositol-2-amino-2-deoxy-alpha-D-glucopyranoside deacetylase
MSPPAAARRIVFVHAHPDDESLDTGATIARYAADGAHVTLVTCTLGEQGEVLVPALAGLAADRADQLGGYRIGELAAALAALGVTDARWLGGAGRWRDSGMMGLPDNDRARAFWRAPAAQTVPLLVDVLREVRPQVLVTYDENGGYGHPDHIQAHRVAMAAVDAAADPGFGAGEPWAVAKVYWSALPGSRLSATAAALAGGDHPFRHFERVADLGVGVPDDVITTSVEGDLDAKLAAMRAHATQVSVEGSVFALADGIAKVAYGTEHFRLVRGTSGAAAGERETDLFAGLV